MSRTVLVLPYDVKGAFLARRCVEQFAAEQKLDGAAGDLCVIASELVTNAILHGAEPVELTLHFQDGEVTIEVADGDPRIDNVRLRAIDQTSPGGRGLRVVASLADRWGTRPLPSGKTVWATTQTGFRSRPRRSGLRSGRKAAITRPVNTRHEYARASRIGRDAVRSGDSGVRLVVAFALAKMDHEARNRRFEKMINEVVLVVRHEATEEAGERGYPMSAHPAPWVARSLGVTP